MPGMPPGAPPAPFIACFIICCIIMLCMSPFLPPANSMTFMTPIAMAAPMPIITNPFDPLFCGGGGG
eukprot:30854-Pelagococcus_subviridis.AAC.14